MKDSKYYKESINKIMSALKKSEEEENETVDPKNSNTKDNVYDDLVCFGLGRFTENMLSFHQLAFILNVQETLKAAATPMENSFNSFYYDPLFDNKEQNILEDFGCNVLSENSIGRYPVKNRRTLFYLPHCPTILTNNLLGSNWTPEQLDNIVIINNSFNSISFAQAQHFLLSEANLIVDILPYTKEIPLDDEYFINNIFNDLSLHVFPQKVLPNAENEEFWQKVPEEPNDDNLDLIINDTLSRLTCQLTMDDE